MRILLKSRYLAIAPLSAYASMPVAYASYGSFIVQDDCQCNFANFGNGAQLLDAFENNPRRLSVEFSVRLSLRQIRDVLPACANLHSWRENFRVNSMVRWTRRRIETTLPGRARAVRFIVRS